MTRWEYRSLGVAVESDLDHSNVAASGEAELSALGDEGWEAYAVVPAALSGPGYYTLDRVVVLLKRAVS